MVITIARSFGSGGKSIALELGERMGIPCYENEILDMASDLSGINKKFFYEGDEDVKQSLLDKMIAKTSRNIVATPMDKNFISNANLFNFQSQIIRELALKEDCIIVGKCADYVLGDLKNVFRFFIDAPRGACINSIMNKLQVAELEADRLIDKTDRYRADYYRVYTGGSWKDPVNYDLIINSAKVGRANVASLIIDYISSKTGRKWR